MATAGKDFKPLTAQEKSDILRAAIGYSLADDMIGIARFREKYAPKMTAKGDREAFDTVSHLVSDLNANIGAIAKMAASFDTLDGFLRDIKIRFSDDVHKPVADKGKVVEFPQPTGSIPGLPGFKPIHRDQKMDLSPAG